MDNQYGGINKEIDKSFFSGLPIISITDLTRLPQDVADKMDEEQKSNYHQILELSFNFHDKVAVLQIGGKTVCFKPNSRLFIDTFLKISYENHY